MVRKYMELSGEWGIIHKEELQYFLSFSLYYSREINGSGRSAVDSACSSDRKEKFIL
jgi:hypothetical protein